MDDLHSRPHRRFRLKRHALFSQRMGERDALRVQAERGVAHGEGLGFSNNAIRQVGRVANDRESKVPE
ncbi:MAG: hypothetical protein WCP34_13620, partial [Pseudomonadota bacterium]